jgi:type I restriction-modification system DNA methylase subunit
MMVRLLAPAPKDKICDPACGTAGFLVSSAEYIRENYESEMTSEEWFILQERCSQALIRIERCSVYLP